MKVMTVKSGRFKTALTLFFYFWWYWGLNPGPHKQHWEKDSQGRANIFLQSCGFVS
jgi:hypothetical protein